MFDIAWSELFVVLIVALVVVGPKDLPRMMRTVGQWAGKARAMADQFRRSFDDMARQSELEELRSEVNRMKNKVVQPITDEEYKALGFDPADLAPLSTRLEDVGAAPPTPLPEAAPAVAASETTAPVVEAEPASAAPEAKA